MKKILLVVLTILLFGLVGCSETITYDESSTYSETITYDESSPYYEYLSEYNPRITIDVKGYGDIVVELFPDVAPITVDNFIAYVQDNAYNNSTFHRIIEDFMVQGGIVENTACAIKGEFRSNGFYNPLKHYQGTIAMARTSLKNSATSQFFINTVFNDYLSNNYAAFGGVIKGLDIAIEMSLVETDSNDAPVNTMTIRSITVDLNGYTPGERTCY